MRKFAPMAQDSTGGLSSAGGVIGTGGTSQAISPLGYTWLLSDFTRCRLRDGSINQSTLAEENPANVQ